MIRTNATKKILKTLTSFPPHGQCAWKAASAGRNQLVKPGAFFLTKSQSNVKAFSGHCPLFSCTTIAGLGLDRHTMFEDHFTAQPAGNRDQDDAKHGQRDGNGVTAADKTSATRGA